MIQTLAIVAGLLAIPVAWFLYSLVRVITDPRLRCSRAEDWERWV